MNLIILDIILLSLLSKLVFLPHQLQPLILLSIHILVNQLIQHKSINFFVVACLVFNLET